MRKLRGKVLATAAALLATRPAAAAEKFLYPFTARPENVEVIELAPGQTIEQLAKSGRFTWIVNGPYFAQSTRTAIGRNVANGQPAKSTPVKTSRSVIGILEDECGRTVFIDCLKDCNAPRKPPVGAN